jgi:hypothetical protein
MAHEAVVERFLRARAILPMQLFTLFTSDARALAHVAANRRAIDRAMARLERQHEWGVRLTLAERAAGARGAVPGRTAAARPRPAETGAAYLSRKRDLVDRDRRRLEEARVEGDRVYRAMAREATASRRRAEVEQTPPASRVVVDAAFLVPVDRTGAFRAAARRQARRLQGTGLGLSVTGPWPPYNFIDAPRRRSS